MLNKVNEEEFFDYMEWAQIEEIVYSEHDTPHRILGPHVVETGIVVQAFLPNAKNVTLKVVKTGKEYEMLKEDEAGYFATLIPGKRIPAYVYIIEEQDGTTKEIYDPYAFEPLVDSVDVTKFSSGIHYEIYDVLGAHVMERNGVKGTEFAVWAPNAMRISVVGDFNQWDGRVHPMSRVEESGIFELFIPGVEENAIYKYEIKLPGNVTFMKADPYGYGSELRPDTASIVHDLNQYEWGDSKWIQERKKKKPLQEPMSIYELHLGSWKKPLSMSDLTDHEENLSAEERAELEEKIGNSFYNYRELAPMVADYVKKMNYTHIEIMPIMEHPLDESWGYQVTGYYAVTSRYGTPEDFMYFMDYMHKKNIGVILDWVPAHFPKDTFGLANFDGTCLYENKDPRRGCHPHWGTLIFDFGRPEVDNFLLGNALFWAEKYHADGIRIDAVASMLYLDYGKEEGEWLPNIYGGNENLEVVALLRKLNMLFEKRKDGVMLIAEESTAWPKVTGEIVEEGLGFDFKWNMGWMNDFLEYMKCDPLFRSGRHGNLTFSMIYQYSENFILTLSHDEVTHGKGSLIQKMPGEYEQKFANLRLAYGFMMTHPGKKLLFMGQDFAQFDEWNEKKSLGWDLIEKYEMHKKMNDYVKALNAFYQDYPALFMMDQDPEGFEWINCMDAERSIVSFLRKTDKEEDTLLVVCNFTPVVYEEFKVGVPFKGKYKETFNSDRKEFGGQGNVNPRLKQAKAEEWDEREQSISITVPPLGICVFTCAPAGKEPGKATAKKTAAKKTTVKKAPVKKTIVKKTGDKEVKAEEKAKAAETTKVEEKAKTKEKAKTTETAKAEEKGKTAETIKTEKNKLTEKAEPEKTSSIENTKAAPKTTLKENKKETISASKEVKKEIEEKIKTAEKVKSDKKEETATSGSKSKTAKTKSTNGK